jgi:asparagine synthase (glutamine-hydrolysing)
VRVHEPEAWWDLEFAPDRSVEDWGPEILATLQAASSEMSYADVPVGAFLSGGVDSSSVTAALSLTGSAVSTFTIGFAESGFDERGFARQVATRYGTKHVEREVVPSDVADVFRDTILWHYDEPFNDYSYLPTYYVCREARDRITVALSGDGGDELFGGYGKYRRLAVRQSLDWALSRPAARRAVAGAGAVAPGSWRTRLAEYGKDPSGMLAAMLTTVAPARRLREAARGPLAEALRHYDPIDTVRAHLEQAPPEEVGLVNSMRYLDLKLTLAGDILVKVDRASMAVSLEVRPVYLHREMLALAARMPPELLADRRETKKPLKSALRSWLPDEILYRDKMGFAMPLGRWLNGDLSELGRALESPDARVSEVLDPAFVGAQVSAHRSAGADFPSVLHSLFFLEHWLETWN